ncbi:MULTISPECIES: peptidylprolyl isomerase [Halomonadaceae]|uniref:peptidylprolyl isomerase n=1 Tax=Halomonadaceae TaxID=28256 RepID=UPI0015979626|nr:MULTISPECIES: peptidylprolyl isomerase [Halomonas]QJQ94780.1 peptidylprolyl isomerase [Halomonas sp. PA5]
MRSRSIIQQGRALLTAGVLGVALLTLSQGALAQAIQPLDRIVAVVNQDAIMASELEERVIQTRSQLEARGIATPPIQTLRSQVLERMVVEELQLQMADGANLRIDDTELNRAVRSIAESNNMTLEQFADALEADGLTLAAIREEVRREMIIREVQQRQVASRVNVSDREVDRFLDQQGSSLGERYRLAHILVALPQSPSPEQVSEAQQKIQRLANELDNGADFAQLAAAESDGGQALDGGELGWRSAGEVPSVFASVVPNLGVGEVSEPLRSPSGFHLVKMIDHDGGTQQVGGPNQRERARQELFQRKANDELDLWLQEVHADAFIQMRL